MGHASAVTLTAVPPVEPAAATEHAISIVVPVYQGERTLEPLIDEIVPLAHGAVTPAGRRFRVAEVVLVHDGAIDDSAGAMARLCAAHPFVRAVFLSRNFGQHAATIAGMATTTGAWVVTLDEDGQHAPADIGTLLDAALREGAQLVYARPTNRAPHGPLRNAASGVTKRLFRLVLDGAHLGAFHSFRLVSGEIARNVAAYSGAGVYLDAALAWVVARTAHCPLRMRDEGRARSGYDAGRLLRHFGRLLMTSGARALRLISLLGAVAVVVAVALGCHALYGKWTNAVPIQGWTSTMVAICFFSGCILFSLGVIAQYVAGALSVALGRPLYLTVSPPSSPSSIGRRS